MSSVKIMVGDCIKALALIPDDSIHCIVTSPPYWGLRDYGVAGQLGCEPSMAEHLEAMVGVFRELRRVLRPDGTVWVNYGDCYAAVPNGRSAEATKAAGKDDRTFRDKPFSTVGPIDRRKEIPRGSGRWGGGNNPAQGYLKPKDLCMIPNRLAIALQDDGWWVRSEIIWHKTNPMPESVLDRPGVSHEKIFLLSKSPKYYYDADAVRQPREQDEDAEGFRGGANVHNATDNDTAGKRQARGNKRVDSENAEAHAKADKQRGHGRRHAGFNARWDKMSREEQIKNGRHLRNVWSFGTKPFRDAHFATFPVKLPEICIKAGCPQGGTVLDPFGGAGTTALAAQQLHRNAILIELNPKYAAIAHRRLRMDARLFADITQEEVK